MNKIIVVKVGSSVITDLNLGLKEVVISNLIQSLKKLQLSGYKPVLVSSGAVAAGVSALNKSGINSNSIDKRALAALGQPLLIHKYIEQAKSLDLFLAQLLLSRFDFILKDSYKNALNTFNELINVGVIPVVNENDSVAKVDSKLKFGDNDMLSALVASLLHAEKLIIITNAKGVFKEDPADNPNSEILKEIKEIDASLLDSIKPYLSKIGTGGMHAKLLAAKLANSLGISVYIGNEYSDFNKVIKKEAFGTYIQNTVNSKLNRQKQWIAFHAKIEGSVVIDQGATLALKNNNASLLPIGVKKIEGKFSAGDTIEIYSDKQEIIAKGKSNFASNDLLKVLGCIGDDVKSKLNTTYDELVHRDNLFVYP